MTIEEFRKRINSGPTAEELKAGFEKRIVDLVNDTVDKREDIREIKTKLNKITDTLEKIQARLEEVEKTILKKSE